MKASTLVCWKTLHVCLLCLGWKPPRDQSGKGHRSLMSQWNLKINTRRKQQLISLSMSGLFTRATLHHLRTLTERSGLCGKRMEVWWIPHICSLCMGLCVPGSTFYTQHTPCALGQHNHHHYDWAWKIDIKKNKNKKALLNNSYSEGISWILKVGVWMKKNHLNSRLMGCYSIGTKSLCRLFFSSGQNLRLFHTLVCDLQDLRCSSTLTALCVKC